MLKSTKIKSDGLKVIRYTLPIIFFFFLSVIFFKDVLFSKGIIVGNDWAMPFNIDQMVVYIRRNFFTWSYDMNLFGVKNPFFVQMPFIILTKAFIDLGLNGEILTKVLIVGIFTLSGTSMFAYLRFLKLRYLTSLVGGFIWITMPFFFNYTIMGWMFVLFSVGIILPITLIIFTQSIIKNNVGYSIIAGILYSIAILQSQSIIWFPIVLIAMSFTLIKEKNDVSKYLKSIIIVLVIGIMLHVSWLPNLFINQDEGVINSDLALDSVSRGMRARLSYTNILKGWGSLYNQPYEIGYAKELIPLSFLIPILALGSILQKVPHRNRVKISMITIFLYMFLLFSIEPEIMAKIPFSNLIRDTARFSALSSFALAILASFFIDHLYNSQKEDKWWKFIACIFLIIINSYSFILGGLSQPALNTYDQRLRTYQFTDDYVEAEKYLSSIKNDTKSYYPPSGTNISLKELPQFNGDFKEIKDPFKAYSPLPGTIYMYYSSMGKPAEISYLLESLFDNKISDSSLSLLGMMNIEYIIHRNNAIYTPSQSENINNLITTIKPNDLKSFGDVQIIKNNYFLPHFYIPKKTIHLEGDIKSITDILSLNDHEIRSAIYFTKNTDDKNTQLLSKPDELIIEAIPVKKLITGFTDIDKLIYPTVNNEPYTFKWYLSTLKEKYYTVKARNDPLYKADVLIWLASKRIAEIQKYNPNEKTEAKLVNDYIKKAKEATSILLEQHNNQKTLESTNISNEYLETSKKILAYMSKSVHLLNEYEYEFISDENPLTLYNNFYSFIDNLAHLSCNINCYTINVPETSKYELFVNKSELDQIDDEAKLILNIKNEDQPLDNIRFSRENSNNNEPYWYRIGETNLESGRDYITNMVLDEMPNLIENDNEWENASTITNYQDDLEILGQSVIPGYSEYYKNENETAKKVNYTIWNDNIIYKKMPLLEPSQKYKISFDYYTDRGELGVSTIEDILDYEVAYQTKNFDWQKFENDKLKFPKKTRTLVDTKISQTNDYVFQKGNSQLSQKEKCSITEDSLCFSHFETIVESEQATIATYLYIYSIPNNKQRSIVKIRNLKLQKVITPKLFVRKLIDSNEIPPTIKIPKIKFVKINPIKYKIYVSEAKTPYTLVFSEGFHKGWKLYKNDSKQTITIKNIPIIYLAKLGEFITNLFVKNMDYGNETANYFDGDITEGTHNNIFIEPSTFETWGKSSISDVNHYKVNGYANAWSISPNDVNSEEEYELIVEFWPQRMFYIGLTVSTLTLMSLIAYLIWIYLKNNHKTETNTQLSNNFLSKLITHTSIQTVINSLAKSLNKITNNKYSKLIISNQKYLIFIFCCGIGIDLFIIYKNSHILTVLLFILWIILIRIKQIKSDSTAKLAIGGIIIIPLFSMLKQTDIAEYFALWTFLFLITTTIQRIHEFNTKVFRDTME